MVGEREPPTQEAAELLGLTRDLVAAEVAPRAAADEEAARFPREVFRTLGRAGLLGLPYPEEYGGGAQPYAVYLQVIEELAAGWLAVGLGVSVHTLACFPLASYGSHEQKARWLAEMLGGELLGSYGLSEPNSGSDAAALTTKAVHDGDAYALTGTKAWITHAGHADFSTVFARTGAAELGKSGISCFHVPAGIAGVTVAPPERKMGMRSSPTAQIGFDQARVPAGNMLGAEGEGFPIALAALDGGRLGIAACAVGVAQAALDTATAYAAQRRQFGQRIADFQGLSFMLADMATAVEAARALYLSAARRRDAGRPYGAQAAMAKLFATDTAMRVTTDAARCWAGMDTSQTFRPSATCVRPRSCRSWRGRTRSSVW